ncbi:hypothetical protein M9Y10_017875 [Tritrichomonas musculus]|uniref:HECT-type E3 ubiquitin transferase n=1 Tax=Tritrichomonas musculus TaxID=1915356 RepID=A0ABR2HV09_9EUKA
MDDSLLLSITDIFEEHNLVDIIRQLYIDFENDPDEERIKDFLINLPYYLDNDLTVNTLSEFISTISICIKKLPQAFIPFLDTFYNKAQFNSNYIILFPIILSYLADIQIIQNIQDYSSFILSALKEILPQLHNESKLIIFGHEIPAQFKISLIVDLLLCADLTEQLIYDFFPFIFTNFYSKNVSNFNALIQKVLNSNTLKISPQTKESNDELYEFLLIKDFHLISKMKKETFSIVECAVAFSKSGPDIDIFGLSKETVLPFIACICVVDQKHKSRVTFSETKIADLICEGIQFIQSNSSPLNSISIDLILMNYNQLLLSKIISTDDFFRILEILSQQLLNGQYLAQKTVIINSIFKLSNKKENSTIQEQEKAFFSKYGVRIVQFILQNSDEFFNCKELKETLLKLNKFDMSEIENVILNSSDICKTIYFIENLCYNNENPVIKHSQKMSEFLMAKFNEKYESKKWADVLSIATFMKKNDFLYELEEIKTLQFPDEIKYKIEEYVPNSDESIDDILSHILSMPLPEYKSEPIRILFEKINENEEMLQMYLTFLTFKYDTIEYDVDCFVKRFAREYEKYPEKFVEAAEKTFKLVKSGNKLGKSLIRNIDFTLYSMNIPEIGSSIVTKLFNAIDERPNNHQAFFCLKSISHSYPLLFYNRQKEVFDHVFPALNDFPLLFETEVTDVQIEMLRTAYSAFSFLVSTFKLPVYVDLLVKTISKNITQYTDAQIACFFSALNYVCNDETLDIMITSLYMKCNFLEKVGEVLERKIADNSFGHWYKDTIYSFLNRTYSRLYQHNNNVLIQLEETSKFDSPICDFYIKVFISYLTFYYKTQYHIDGINHYAKDFIYESEKMRLFWLPFDHLNNRESISIKSVLNFIQKFEQIQQTEMTKYDNISPEAPYTIKMIRYIVTQPISVYRTFLFAKSSPYYQTLYERTLNTYNKCREMYNEALLHPDDYENFNIADLDQSNILFPLFCQPTLMKNIIHQESLNLASDESLIYTITKYNIAMLFMLDLIGQELSSVYENDKSCELPSSINYVSNLIDILKCISEGSHFEENFVDMCGNKLLDIILSPEWRSKELLLEKTSALFCSLNNNLPIRLVHLIGFILISNYTHALPYVSQLYKKFSEKQQENMNVILIDYFDKIIDDPDSGEIVNMLLEMMPSLVQVRSLAFYSILEQKLEMYSKQETKDPADLKYISFLLNELAPKRVNSISLNNVIRESSIPPHIQETSPPFWSLFDKYKDMIIGIIDKDPFKLEMFSFLLRFPELISFSTRSYYFRKKMKSRIRYELTILHVDRSNLLTTSFRAINNLSTSDLMNFLQIKFKNEEGVDQEGLTREWFTELAKEIFNQNYGLFDCSTSNLSYKPNSLSSVNPNHLEYFRFAGLFIARALIQGICIDAHLTTSFLKQILHRTPKLNDLEDIDEEMYNSLKYIQDSEDVESLELTFSIDKEELGVVKTILLKENGDQILVTNENKNEFIELRQNYIFRTIIEDQLKEFTSAFDSLISHEDIRIFTPDELDLLICGIPEIDVDDFRNHVEYELPYDKDTPVIKMFFNVISRWDNEKKAKLLMFMTGSSRVPSNGFKEFCEVCRKPLIIASGGDSSKLPQSHTCLNMLCIPQYKSEEELNDKLLFAIYNANGYELR